MLWRLLALLVAAPLVMLGPVGSAIAAGDGPGESSAMLTKQEDGDEPVLLDRDDDDDDDQDLYRGGGDDTDDSDSGGFTSGQNSNDGTNSRRTGVTHNTDRSRGDLTRDRTKDGPGGSTIDRSRHQTNDGSRHDTR